MRDAVPMRDPLTSLNSRLCRASDSHSPAEKGLLRMATFLHRELPIRFARGITFIDKLNVCREAPSLNVVRDCYLQSFRDIVTSPCPITDDGEASFVNVLEQVGDRHADELLLVARGLYELRSKLGMDVLERGGSFEALHAQLDELHLKRIALRILIGHYLALHRPARQDYVVRWLKEDVSRMLEILVVFVLPLSLVTHPPLPSPLFLTGHHLHENPPPRCNRSRGF